MTSLGWKNLWCGSFIRPFEARLVSVFILLWGVFPPGGLTRCLLCALSLFSSHVFSPKIWCFLFSFAVMTVSTQRVWLSLVWSVSSRVVCGSMFLLWWLLRLKSLLRHGRLRDCFRCFVGQSVRVQGHDRLLTMSVSEVNLVFWQGLCLGQLSELNQLLVFLSPWRYFLELYLVKKYQDHVRGYFARLRRRLVWGDLISWKRKKMLREREREVLELSSIPKRIEGNFWGAIFGCSVSEKSFQVLKSHYFWKGVLSLWVGFPWYLHVTDGFAWRRGLTALHEDSLPGFDAVCWKHDNEFCPCQAVVRLTAGFAVVSGAFVLCVSGC